MASTLDGAKRLEIIKPCEYTEPAHHEVEYCYAYKARLKIVRLSTDRGKLNFKIKLSCTNNMYRTFRVTIHEGRRLCYGAGHNKKQYEATFVLSGEFTLHYHGYFSVILLPVFFARIKRFL